MSFPVRLKWSTASVGSSHAPTDAVDHSAPSAIRPESTYISGKVVQTNGATSHRDLHVLSVAKLLQFMLPEMNAVAVAPTAVSADEELRGVRVAFSTHSRPPLADACDGKLGCIGGHSNIDPADVRTDVVDPIRNRFRYVWVRKVMAQHFDWPTFVLPFMPVVLVFSD